MNTLPYFLFLKDLTSFEVLNELKPQLATVRDKNESYVEVLCLLGEKILQQSRAK